MNEEDEESKGPKSFAEEARRTIRKHPMAATVAAAGFGFMASDASHRWTEREAEKKWVHEGGWTPPMPVADREPITETISYPREFDRLRETNADITFDELIRSVPKEGKIDDSPHFHLIVRRGDAQARIRIDEISWEDANPHLDALKEWLGNRRLEVFRRDRERGVETEFVARPHHDLERLVQAPLIGQAFDPSSRSR